MLILTKCIQADALPERRTILTDCKDRDKLLTRKRYGLEFQDLKFSPFYYNGADAVAKVMRGYDQLVCPREDNPAQQSGVLSTQKTCRTLIADQLIKSTAQEANTTCENVDKACIDTISNFYNHILSGGVELLDSKSNSREFFLKI